MSVADDRPGPDGPGPGGQQADPDAIDGTDDGELVVPPPNITVRLAAAALGLEAVVVFFAALVAIGLTVPAEDGLSRTTLLVGGLVLAVVFVLAAGIVRRPGGIAIGWVLQLVLIALGLVVPVMFVLGALFLLMWLWFLRLGKRVDGDRRRWAADLAAGGTGRD